ncbi:MAG TPA: DUF6152 family protein [Terriglobia bacterium]|jgi:hypothetical protein|nr:DUF6152 family protein [Terriglobia bacterium]
MRKSLLSLVIAGSLLLAIPVVAHHSISAEFDTSKPITFTGTVKKVAWMNPHIYTHVEVKQPNGAVIEYRVEGGPPNALYRSGWREDSLKVGETVTVSGVRAKSETSMNIGTATIKKADGTAVFGR